MRAAVGNKYEIFVMHTGWELLITDPVLKHQGNAQKY